MNKLLLLLALVVFSHVCFRGQTPRSSDDLQFWNETRLTIPLVKTTDRAGKKTEKVSLFLTGVLRFGDNVSRPVTERGGFGFDFKLNKYVSLTPSYLYIAAQPARGRREYEHRLRLAATLEKKFRTFTVRDRNQIEYRSRHSRSDSVRYRNKLQFNIPVRKSDKEIFTPFVSDEVYYDFQAGTWNRNDFSAGLSRKVNRNLTTDFFYTFRANRGSGLKYVNIFGVNLKFKID